MTNSDIIAMIALVVSFISAGISLWNNRANIKAKRQEIALEKRLEAFRQIYEAISKHENLMREILFPIPPRDKDLYMKSYDNFAQIYRSNRVYIPSHIDKLLFSYNGMLSEYAITLYPDKPIDPSEYEFRLENPFRIMQDTEDASKKILEEMQKFIGFK
jgi:hypothetical protein